jgi:4-amino-4-deoxy-L-arabinose transferase-like glycosyltransferase
VDSSTQQGTRAAGRLADPAPDVDRHPPVSRRERGVVTVVSVVFLAVMLVWAVLTPPFSAPDEPAHLNSALRLTEGFSWPAPGEARITNAVIAARDEAALPASERSSLADLAEENPGTGGVDQMTQHPPLYYLYVAGVLNLVGASELRADVALLVMRLCGIVLALPLPALVWASVRRVTRSPRAAVVGAAAVLAVPQLAQILASASNDPAAVLACSVTTLLLVRIMTGDTRSRTVIAAGGALGFALLTKGTALPFIPFLAVVIAVWPRAVPLRSRLLRAVASLVIAFGVGGWWWARNLLVFRDLQPSGLAPSRETKPWAPGTGPDIVSYLDLMWGRLSSNFWGDFGSLDYPLPELVTDVLSVVCIVVVLIALFTRRSDRLRMRVLAALPAILFLMLVVNTWRHFVRTQAPAGMQGRYFYVTIVVLIVLSALAWRSMVAVERRVSVATTLLGVFAALAALGLLRQYIGVYELSQYRVSLTGFRIFADHATVGLPGILLTAGFLAVAAVLALVATVRFVRLRPRDVVSV